MSRIAARLAVSLVVVNLAACTGLPTVSAHTPTTTSPLSNQSAANVETVTVPALAAVPAAPPTSDFASAPPADLATTETSSSPPPEAQSTLASPGAIASFHSDTAFASNLSTAAQPSGSSAAASTLPFVAITPTGADASLGPLTHITQTFNNCGPASVAEVLRYWGIIRTQGQAQAVLRADGNSHGMAPYGVPAYARGLGLDALMGTRGDDAVVKALVSNGFPVIVSQWVSLTDHVGHYRPIEGFDDARGVFISSDPYLGANHEISYQEFDKIWASNNGRFMVLYPPSKQARLQAVLASAGWDKTAAYEADLSRVESRLALHQQPGDAYGRFWKGNSGLALAWDKLELGQVEAARASLDEAAAQHANPVVVNWIAQELARVSPVGTFG